MAETFMLYSGALLACIARNAQIPPDNKHWLAKEYHAQACRYMYINNN